MTRVLTAELRAQAIATASRANVGTVLSMLAGGVELTREGAAELLAKAVNRELVALELTVLAYEQKTGERNRNAVRFRDGAMLALGRSGKTTPFLRDHRQGDSTAKGGVVLDSKTVKLDEGHYRIEQTVRLTDPPAVERALRGLMGSVSIGWNPTGPIECSACGKPVLQRGSCWHWPGDEIVLNGGTEKVVVEWIYTSAELLETSEVSVPGVPSAGIEGVRAALSAALNCGGDTPPPEEHAMKHLSAFLALLTLPATAGEDEVLTAVTNQKAKLTALEAQNGELVKLQAKHAAESAAAAAQLAAHEVDEFIAAGVQAGKIVPGTAIESSLRSYHAVDKDGAAALLATMPRVTPVGQERQSNKPPPVKLPTAGKLEAAAQRITQHSPLASLDGVRKSLLAMGKSVDEANRIIEGQIAPAVEA